MLSPDENERLRAVVRRLLVTLDVTQVELADRLGMKQSTISGFLSERQGSSYATARRVARLAGIQISSIIDGADEAGESDEEASERNVRWDAVMRMGFAQGFDGEFLENWRPPRDEEETADDLWTRMKAAYLEFLRSRRAAKATKLIGAAKRSADDFDNSLPPPPSSRPRKR